MSYCPALKSLYVDIVLVIELDDIRLADSWSTFQCQPKHYLLQQSYQMLYSNYVTSNTLSGPSDASS